MIQEAVEAEVAKRISILYTLESESSEDCCLGTDKASEFLNISIHTLRSKVQQRKIPHYKDSNRTFFLKSELMEWIEERRVKTNAQIQNEVEMSNNKLSKKLKI